MTGIKISEYAQDRLRCPVCYGGLRVEAEAITCANGECGSQFPVVEEVPVLLNAENSIFSIDDFTEHRRTTWNLHRSKANRFVRSLIPAIGTNLKDRRNYKNFAELLVRETKPARVLVIGGSVAGHGMEELLADPAIDFVETDVSFGPRTAMICDAHDIPFADASFDGVIAQAVLEHVADPYRCVSELHRVLKPNGLVYAETPFMQQVHAGRFDFTRFSHLGHRRLFRQFSEVNSGVNSGAGSVLAWSYCYFLQSWFTNQRLGQIAFVFGSFTGFWLKYFDHLFINKPTAYDAASSYFFIGQKSETCLSDKDLIKGYKGLIY